MNQAIQLLSLDFDGTLLVYDEPVGVFHPEVIVLLNELEELGVGWCTNSGREQRDQHLVLAASMRRGLRHLPCALISSESLIFERKGVAYHPVPEWNDPVLAATRRLQREVQRLLQEGDEAWRQVLGEATFHAAEHYTAFNVAETDGRADRLFEALCRLVAPLPEAMVTRNGGWIGILATCAGKGRTLKAYAERVGIHASRILAVGDHHNDLNMLDGQVAHWVACPGNSMPEVKASVLKAGGYVSEVPGPEGTVQAIRHVLGLATAP